MTTTFKIVQAERTLPANVVTTLHWNATQVDGDYTASSYGSVGLPAIDPAASGFIAYDSLTEAQAIEWLTNALGAEQVGAINTALAGQIQAQKNPTSASGLPW